MARVLVVDDDEMERAYLETVLGASGHDVRVAADGKQALRAVSEGGVDVVLTDLFMPNCDGLELIRHLRDADKRVPIIVVSSGIGDVLDPILRAALLLGATALLYKPASPQEIADAVEQVARPATGAPKMGSA